ncbi:TPA: acyl carrier protein, partial [Staphylococcus pseudintermedius]|nr:acyl carrier protein [Staphylococcus pseudintermedius]
KDIETFLKFSKLMLKDNGKLHIIDFCKMDPVSILTAIFFQEEYLDIETEKRTQFFYKTDYIKKLVKKYYIKSTLFSAGNDSVFYFESENHTNYFELIRSLENNIGFDCDEKIVWISPKSLDSCNNMDGIIQTNVNSYNENIEDILKTIWIKNLEIDNIDSDSNYFKLGGNSLSATKLLVEIEKKLKCKLTLNEVFSNPEFESLLSLIDSKQINTEIIEGEI